MIVFSGLVPRISTRAAHFHDFGERFSGERFQRVVLEINEQDIVERAGEQEHVLPLIRWRVHFLDDALETAILHPGWHSDIQARGAGGVGVDVGRNVQALGSRLLDHPHGVIKQWPVLLAGRLEVIDFRGDARPAGDRDQLIDRLQHVCAFIAHVRDVHAVVLGGRLRQRNQLGSVGEQAWRVHQRRGDAHSPFAHGFADQLAHLLQFPGRRRAVLVANDIFARRRRADERSDVRRNAPPHEVIEIFPERRPLDVVANVRLAVDQLLLHRTVQRPHRVAFAHHLEGYALPDIALRAAVVDQRLIRPGQHVDEAG
jgi:hypothetical protein